MSENQFIEFSFDYESFDVFSDSFKDILRLKLSWGTYWGLSREKQVLHQQIDVQRFDT